MHIQNYLRVLGGLLLLAAVAQKTNAGAPTIGAAARSFPDTHSKIAIFTDQLPGQMTDAQMRFAASHYVGTQKMPRSWTRKIRLLNPGFIVIHYQLALGTGPAAFLDGEQWTNDFSEVTRHEDWFLHDNAGRRLLQPAWNWYVMDIRFKDGKPTTGFPNYWVNSAVQRMRDNEDDGCFADSYTQDILVGQLKPSFEWFTSADANKKYWLPELNQFGAYCAAQFHRQPEKFYYLPNLGGLVTTWDRTDYAIGDGGMNEGFCSSGPGQYNTVDDWKMEMTRMLKLAALNKILLCQTGTDPADGDQRWLVVGSYLLTKGPHSYLNLMHKSSLEWYPEYNLVLGSYKEDPPQDVATLWRADWRVFRRDYQKGMVLVNPSADPVTIPDLGGMFKLVSAHGGGAVTTDGLTSGSLDMTPVNHLTIPGHSARVLIQ